jgi:hypothetical protein
MEGMTSEEWMDVFDLKPVFYEILKDERFKPKK